MGDLGKAKQQGAQAFDQTSSTTFAPASAEELALRQRFTGLGEDQIAALKQILQQSQGSAFAMTPQDRTLLDTAFDAARTRLQIEGKDYADFLSGGRGLRMSDTPISQQALNRFGLAMGDLESNKARTALELGLAGNQARWNTGLMGAQALPAGSVAAFNPLFSERMASGTQRVSGTGTSNMTYTQPLMQTILQGTQAFQNLGSTVSGFFGGGVNSPAAGFKNF